MQARFEIVPISWYHENECDEQPTAVLVQSSNGDTQYLTIEEYKKLKNEHRIYTSWDSIKEKTNLLGSPTLRSDQRV